MVGLRRRRPTGERSERFCGVAGEGTMMANLSDALLQAAMVTYLAAMTCYLVEFSFGRRGAVARVAARPDRELVVVGGASLPVQPSGGSPVESPVESASGDVRPTAAVGSPAAVRATCSHGVG